MPGCRASRGWRGRVVQRLVRSVAAAVAAVLVLVLVLRFVPPPTSSIIMQRRFAAWRSGAPAPRQVWVPWEAISPYAALAVVAAEDQRFPLHWGVDPQAIADAWEEGRRGERQRGASTITQQVAKNLFLWPGHSYVRKGLEAGLAVTLEALWPKQRILEVYLNLAEMGDGVFGVEAASRRFFGKPAAHLTREEAALLAAVLPNPRRLRVDRPSAYVLQRRRWILQQMQQLGSGYLSDTAG